MDWDKYFSSYWMKHYPSTCWVPPEKIVEEYNEGVFADEVKRMRYDSNIYVYSTLEIFKKIFNIKDITINSHSWLAFDVIATYLQEKERFNFNYFENKFHHAKWSTNFRGINIFNTALFRTSFCNSSACGLKFHFKTYKWI